MPLVVEAAAVLLGLGVALGVARLALGILLAMAFGRVQPQRQPRRAAPAAPGMAYP